MKIYKKLIVLFIGVIAIVACNDYINNVEAPNDWVEDSKLTAEGQLEFIITGILQRNSQTAPYISAMGDLLADAMIYEPDNALASFPTFQDIDRGDILLTNGTVTEVYNWIHEERFYADSLVDRANLIQFKDENIKKRAFYYGYFYGALMRFYLGAYFGNPASGQFGATINNSAFIPQAQLFDQAIDRFKLALANAANAADTRIVNSYLAKVSLAKKDYANVATYAALGMKSGDADFLSLNSLVSSAWYWGFAGVGRVQIIVNNRFKDYITQDPIEAGRIKLLSLLGRATPRKTYYYQAMYDKKESPFVMMTWQENNLMLAEAILRGAGTGDALKLVNDVRASHLYNGQALSPLASVNLDVLYVERDKELFVRGSRMLDQYRFDKWTHLPAGRAKFLPLPQREVNGNPNY
jgi:hypothetical protein